MTVDKSDRPLKLMDLENVDLNASDAFLAMGRFLAAYHARTSGEGALATICADIQIEDDGMSVDPAALSDWSESVRAVLQRKAP